MSSEEDFSLVVTPAEKSLEEVLASISVYKKKHEQLLQEQKDLIASRDDRRSLAQDFRRRTQKLTKDIELDKCRYAEQLEREKAKLDALKQDETELIQQIMYVKEAQIEEDSQIAHLKEQTDVFASVPERNVVFKGATGGPGNTPVFDMEPRIVYPMIGGTALITFEEEVVAKKILGMPEHQVDLGQDCRITVEARPVELMMPRVVEISSEVCPQRILISNLPKMDSERLLDQLEIHFSKSKNGGGEVDSCEIMSDSWTVVLTFVNNSIAKGLTDKEFHEVKLKNTKHRVRVTPFVNGNITNLETHMSVCPRTVLLTGIPDVMDQENLQDMLEIHFQKSSNGGGEIEAILYNPPGQEVSALFKAISQKEEEEEEEEDGEEEEEE